MDYEQLGEIMLATLPHDEILLAYNTLDPYWVGKYAIGYKDINWDGTLN